MDGWMDGLGVDEWLAGHLLETLNEATRSYNDEYDGMFYTG